MKVYTAIVFNSYSQRYSSDRMECKTFKTFDGAVEYLMDFLVDGGFIDMDEVPEVAEYLMKERVFVTPVNEKEIRIEENELCNW